MKRAYKGFSLIEILIVVGLILILAAVTIVAINPAKHFRDTRNSERMSHISEILNAVTQYTTEEGAVLGDLNIPLCSETTDDFGDVIVFGDDAADLNLAELVPTYIVEIPQDPQVEGDTGYTLCQTDGGRVQIGAMLETDGLPVAETVVR